MYFSNASYGSLGFTFLLLVFLLRWTAWECQGVGEVDKEDGIVGRGGKWRVIGHVCTMRAGARFESLAFVAGSGGE